MKTRRLEVRGILAIAVFVSACKATVGVGGMVDVPSDSATTCKTHCESIGMKLGAVAIMANNVGCVCQPPDQPAPSNAAVTAGMATIAMQDAEEARRRAAQQRR
ncbi:MAG: hypothetical protein HOW73_12080 [Polyangiaceae bacterium]|nr:hypothetical protein [Polyangiaceae bacterium]